MNIQGTTLETSRLALGTHSLHRLLSGSRRRNLLALALDLGVRHFDTAPSYGDGVAERELGRLARSHRSELVLTTKFGIPGRGLGGRLPGWNHVAMVARAASKVLRGGGARHGTRRRDFGAEHARKSLEGSLRALATDHIEVLFLHEPSIACLVEPEALGRVLEALKAAGKVRYVGLSGQYEECDRISAQYPFLADILQVQVPAAPDGLPLEGYRNRAAIGFWEFPPGFGRATAGSLQHTLARLAAAVPTSVRLVSTNSESQLREAAAILGCPTAS